MVTDRTPHSKGRVDVVFKIGLNIIKKIYDFNGLYGKPLYNSISNARFLREYWDGDSLGNSPGASVDVAICAARS